MRTIDEIKTTTLPPEFITGEQSPEHWAQAQCYAAIYALQDDLPAMRVRLTYYQVDEELEFNLDVYKRQLHGTGSDSPGSASGSGHE